MRSSGALSRRVDFCGVGVRGRLLAGVSRAGPYGASCCWSCPAFCLLSLSISRGLGGVDFCHACQAVLACFLRVFVVHRFDARVGVLLEGVVTWVLPLFSSQQICKPVRKVFSREKSS
jgi:hypothetical protein